MTTINKESISLAAEFLIRQATELVHNNLEKSEGQIPFGPKFKISSEVNPHTKLGKIKIYILVGEEEYNVYTGTFNTNIKGLKLSPLEKEQIVLYTGYGIYNVVNHETDFDKSLTNMLTNATLETTVKHFSGIEIKYHREDDSQRFLIQRGKDVYYALEEAVFIQDGIAATSMTTPQDLTAKAEGILADWLQSFEIPEFEHEFN